MRKPYQLPGWTKNSAYYKCPGRGSNSRPPASIASSLPTCPTPLTTRPWRRPQSCVLLTESCVLTNSAELFQHNNSSVPARLGKGQGAKEIGDNLARERPSRAHFYARTPKIRAQSSTQMKQDLGTNLWAIDENTGTNLLQAFLYS